MTQDPGAPRTDELARNVAYNNLAETAEEEPSARGGEIAHAILRYHTVTWERDVNSAGVAVRRYVLRGAWEVDPEAVTP